MGNVERPQGHVDQPEERGVGAQPYGEREDRRGRERLVGREEADGMAQVRHLVP
jgi:hypothetical protein